MKTGPVQQLLLLEAPPSPLSSRPEKSWAFRPPKVMKNTFCAATTLNGSAALPFVISTGGVMGLRPTQGDEERVLFSNHCCWKRQLSPLSSRPEESWAFGPPKAMKNGSCSATTLNGSAALPFVISTGGVMGLRPTQGDEKRVLFSNYTQWKRRHPLCHFDRRSHGPSAHPRR